MSSPRLEIAQATKAFGKARAVTGFSQSIHPGEVVGLVGPNGAGKTTLFNLITGFQRPDEGSIRFDGKTISGFAPRRIAAIGVARTFQDVRLVWPLTVLDNLILAVRDQRRERLRDLLFRPGATATREEELRSQATALLRSLGLEDLLGFPAEHLSYGQRKLVSILACVAAGASLLLLDEPVAGVAPDLRDKILSLIRSLRNEGKSVLLIEHDFDAVSSVCDRVVFMDLGQIRGEGTPDQIRKNPTVIEAYLS